MSIKTWQELLLRELGDVGKEFGPQSREVISALITLKEGDQWFDHVGESLPSDSSLMVVSDWNEALTIFQDRKVERYNINGHLIAAHRRVETVLLDSPERMGWWQKAGEYAKRYDNLDAYIPESLPEDMQELLFEHLYELVSMFLAEIVASPEANCQYFRELLQWFYAGHFPCGWEGDWPVGRMRVF